MAMHVWDIKKFSESTKRLASSAFCWALQDEANLELAVTFVGYVIERKKQTAHVNPRYMWTSAKRYNFRFMRGENAVGYHSAGLRLLEDFSKYVDLDFGAPLEMSVDKLREGRGFKALYEELKDA